MKFRGELLATGGTTTGFQVGDEFVAGLGGGGRPKVVVTVNGHSWRGSIARMGGSYWLGVSAERRAEAGIAAGDVLEVGVELDTAVREVDVPEDLAAALEASPGAKAFWAGLSYSNKSWHVLQVTGAKTAETRTRRIEKSITLLAAGRAR
ncbi:YdeI/OmpD-associated family protein [Pseudosporangium ferrugineum]|uniref:Uncharacterized protein DUF1905 n=1 Tax=Pseudosporangium ferrugineum TaxID=439699 RepID=A0A2T0RUF7_9ACTN|nr:YdeI/OmpD-associated family protein [Pseudosporangium ferrugineum]PRY24780.1 uncharacterized protein DUF1905 [Pseudosporangium ferrugineum]